MDTISANKKTTSLRLDAKFHSFLTNKAKQENRSFDDYVEALLSEASGYSLPNKDTVEAIREIEEKGFQLEGFSTAKALIKSVLDE